MLVCFCIACRPLSIFDFKTSTTKITEKKLILFPGPTVLNLWWNHSVSAGGSCSCWIDALVVSGFIHAALPRRIYSCCPASAHSFLSGLDRFAFAIRSEMTQPGVIVHRMSLKATVSFSVLPHVSLERRLAGIGGIRCVGMLDARENLERQD